MEKKRIAVIAHRFKTVDDDAVEAEKWIDKYLRLGYEVHLIGGKFGEPTDIPKLEIPELDFKNSEVRGVKRIMFANSLDKQGKKATKILLNSLVSRIKPKIRKYISSKKIDILSIENILGNLKNPAATIAISKIVKDTGLPTISKYASFFWEEPYFAKNNNFPDLLEKIIPDSKNVVHVTTSTKAQECLKSKKKVNSIIVPSTIDINSLSKPDEFNSDFRKSFNISDDQLIFLQPTRINRKKGIEHSIKIVREINEITKKKHVLMITGPPVYFRGDYFEEIVKKLNKSNVRAILAHDKVFISRHQNKEQKFYSMGDAYLHADAVLFPVTNDELCLPALYAMAYKKPLLVNKHPNIKDIADKSPHMIEIEGKITPETISDLYELLVDSKKRNELVNHNFSIISENYSSDILDDAIVPILNKFEEASFMKRLKKRLFTRNSNNKNPDLKNNKGSYKEPKK